MARPTHRVSPPLAPEERSDVAMLRILARLVDAVRANVDGVIEDLGPEPLHDLRVATRRTRVALSICKSVLPDTVVQECALGFKWLGSVTGPRRDLDVHLIEMEAFQRRLGISDDSIEPLRHLLEELREEEHLRVCECLRSERFRGLIDGCGEILTSESGGEIEPRKAGRPVIDLAGRNIHKAYRKCVERGSRIADDPREELFHRLRIDAKKLRYLLEFFSDLYSGETIRSLVKELKRLQDILGGFNDMVVQRDRFAVLSEQLTASGAASPDTLKSTNRLALSMAERQEELRLAFDERFPSFAGADNRRLYRKTFS